MGTICTHGTTFRTLVNDSTALSSTERKVVAVSGGEALIIGVTTTSAKRYSHNGSTLQSTTITLPAQLAYRVGNDLLVVNLS